MNFISRTFARHSRFAVKRYFSTSPQVSAATVASRQSVRESFNKLMLAEAAPAVSTTTLVKDAIKKMMTNRGVEDIKPIQDEELEQRFQHFQSFYQEAECCIDDLREAGKSNNVEYEEELQCANGAVDNCFNSFVDLLEDLRRADDKQLEAYNIIRSENVLKLKNLRSEIDMIIQKV